MTRRSSDDGERGPVGILLSLRKDGSGIEVTMDNVALDRATGFRDSRNRLWRHEWFTTFLNLPPEFDRSVFTQEKLANFGLTVLGSIYGLAQRVPPIGSPSEE